MSFPPRFWVEFSEQAKKLAVQCGNALGNLFRRVADDMAELRVRVLFSFDRMPVGRRRLVFVTAGVFVVLLLIVIGTALLGKNETAEQKISSTGNAAAQQVIIPPDELFLPEEPDFVPGVLLEREQRDVWTAEDAEPFWQDPLKNGELEWRDRIEKAVDGIMESVH